MKKFWYFCAKVETQSPMERESTLRTVESKIQSSEGKETFPVREAKELIKLQVKNYVDCLIINQFEIDEFDFKN